ncbi:MAG: sn-glycerol-1-phosphate dehydrogenase [Eubacteriales bacterium]
MKRATTNPLVNHAGAKTDMQNWIGSHFAGKSGIAVCDTNTLRYAESALGNLFKVIYDSDVTATDIYAKKITDAVSSGNISYLVACGSGTIHDLTRFAAHAAGIPFVSYPTAASVDGFVSNVAAMTIGGRKVTYPSTAPAALFADSEVYRNAPAALTASGVGDIVGKYISLFDWKVGNIITGEPIDSEIYSLEEEAVKRVMETDVNSDSYTEIVMECLILSGMAIQYMGSSRPASGAEHHLSHLWEMHCINAPTPALHGEKVGVSTLLVLEEYKRLAVQGIKYRALPGYFTHAYLEPVYGTLTDGIIEENTPDPFESITAEHVAECGSALIKLIGELPEPASIRQYLKTCGAKTTLDEIGLPETEAFKNLSLKYAPFVRRRLTLLKLAAAGLR